MEATTILPYLQMVLAIGNIIIMGYACVKFLGRPRTSIESRLSTAETELREIKERLLKGNDNFRAQEETNQVLIHSVLALIEFEIQFCIENQKPLSKDLEKAKENLHAYLARR